MRPRLAIPRIRWFPKFALLSFHLGLSRWVCTCIVRLPYPRHAFCQGVIAACQAFYSSLRRAFKTCYAALFGAFTFCSNGPVFLTNFGSHFYVGFRSPCVMPNPEDAKTNSQFHRKTKCSSVRPASVCCESMQSHIVIQAEALVFAEAGKIRILITAIYMSLLIFHPRYLGYNLVRLLFGYRVLGKICL